MQGIIALDVDGTLIDGMGILPVQVEQFLARLAREGWAIIFITGRTFVFGHYALSGVTFPHTFAVQNGALILEMSSRKILARNYLSQDVLPVLQEMTQEGAQDFVIYGGYETKDTSYYRSRNFSQEYLDYFEARRKVYLEEWHDVASFKGLELPEFPSVKWFAPQEEAREIARKVEARLDLHVPVIRDPFGRFFVAQGTRKETTKGKALQDFMATLPKRYPLIAAGDDQNDRPMLDLADVKVVMQDAPKDLLALADIVAPPAAEMGIIKGLTEAIKRI